MSEAKLFRKVKVYTGYSSANAEEFYEEWECGTTGRWKIVTRNGVSSLYIQNDIPVMSRVCKSVQKERKWFKFLGLKTVEECNYEQVADGEWVHEDELILIEETINECCEVKL